MTDGKQGPLEDDPYVQAMLALNNQTQHDIALLVSVIALQALEPRRTRKGLADLIDRAGGDNPLYKTSAIKAMAEGIRGGTFRPDLTLIQGGRADTPDTE